MKLWMFPKCAPQRRRVSTKLSASYETRRAKELRAARERFLAGK